MMKNNKKLIEELEKILNDEGEKINEQNFIQMNSQEKVVINEIRNIYGNKKICMNLLDLLYSSNSTRARYTPRPQNPFILFRKNLSKALSKSGKSMTVGKLSNAASPMWHTITKSEKDFWKFLSDKAKKLHEINYPDYKFKPVKFNKIKDDLEITQTNNDNNNNDLVNADKNESFNLSENIVNDNNLLELFNLNFEQNNSYFRTLDLQNYYNYDQSMLLDDM